MTAKKKAAPKKDAPRKATLAPEVPKARTAIASTPPKPLPPRDSYGATVVAHMQGHGLHENPWSAMNAGGVCGICKERVR